MKAQYFFNKPPTISMWPLVSHAAAWQTSYPVRHYWVKDNNACYPIRGAQTRPHAKPRNKDRMCTKSVFSSYERINSCKMILSSHLETLQCNLVFRSKHYRQQAARKKQDIWQSAWSKWHKITKSTCKSTSLRVLVEILLEIPMENGDGSNSGSFQKAGVLVWSELWEILKM